MQKQDTGEVPDFLFQPLTRAVSAMRGLAYLASFPFPTAEGGEFGGDLLLHPHLFVQLVGGAKEVKGHLRLQRQGGGARLPPQQHLGAFRIVSRRNREAAAHQRLLEHGQVGGAGGQAGGREELPVQTARQRSHLEQGKSAGYYLRGE